jgi:Family of unknown function (DUF6056)
MPPREHAQGPTSLSRAGSIAVPAVRGKLAVLASGAIVLAIFAMVAAVALASWPTADDYCNSVLVAQGGIGGALHWLFFEWSGRIASGIPLYAAFALVDLPALRFVSIVLVCLLAVAAFQTGSLLAGEDLPLRWPLCAFVFAAFALGLYRLLGQAVLWSTGGIVYMLPLVLSLAWLGSVRRLLQDRVVRGGPAYGFALGILTGNSIELVWPILIAYVSLVAPSRWHAISSSGRQRLATRVAGLAAGMLLLIVAPGNYARARVTPGSFTLEPIHLVGQYIGMLKAIVEIAWPMVAIIGVAATVSLLAWRGATRYEKSPILPPPVRESVALAIGALLSVVPVLAAPAQFAPRNGFYLLVFALVAALLPAVAYARHARWRQLAAPALIVLAALGTLVISTPLMADARQSSAIRDKQAARDRMLRELPRENPADVTVPPIGLWPVPSTLHFVEVDAERSQWNNVCMAKYYGVRSIALERPAR